MFLFGYKQPQPLLRNVVNARFFNLEVELIERTNLKKRIILANNLRIQPR